MLKAKYPSLSRREFLTTAACAGGAALLGPMGLARREMGLIRA